MNRSDIVASLAERFPQLLLKDVEHATDVILEAIGAAAARRHRVELRGFGTFKIREHLARTGRNPRTGAAVRVPPRSGVSSFSVQ